MSREGESSSRSNSPCFSRARVVRVAIAWSRRWSSAWGSVRRAFSMLGDLDDDAVGQKHSTRRRSSRDAHRDERRGGFLGPAQQPPVLKPATGPVQANSTTARARRRRLAATCPAPAKREDDRARIAGARSSRAEPVNRDTSRPWTAPPTVDGTSTVSRPVDRRKDVLRKALTSEATDRPFQLSYPTPAPGAGLRPRGAVDRASRARRVSMPCRIGCVRMVRRASAAPVSRRRVQRGAKNISFDRQRPPSEACAR